MASEIHGQAGDDGHDERSEVCRWGRPRGGEATEWDPREPQAPEGKGTATLKFRTAARLKCWGHSWHCATTDLHVNRKMPEGGDLHWGLRH